MDYVYKRLLCQSIFIMSLCANGSLFAAARGGSKPTYPSDLGRLVSRLSYDEETHKAQVMRCLQELERLELVRKSFGFMSKKIPSFGKTNPTKKSLQAQSRQIEALIEQIIERSLYWQRSYDNLLASRMTLHRSLYERQKVDGCLRSRKLALRQEHLRFTETFAKRAFDEAHQTELEADTKQFTLDGHKCLFDKALDALQVEDQENWQVATLHAFEMIDLPIVKFPCAEVTKLEEIRMYLSDCQIALERVEIPRGGSRWQDDSKDVLAHYRSIYEGSDKTAEDRLLWDKQRNAILLHGIHQQLSLEFHEELNAFRMAYGTACQVLSSEQDVIFAKIRILKKEAADREARDLLKKQRRRAQELLQEKRAQERQAACLRAQEVARFSKEQAELARKQQSVQAELEQAQRELAQLRPATEEDGPTQASAAPAPKKKSKKVVVEGGVDPVLAFLNGVIAEKEAAQEEQLRTACGGAVFAWLQEAEKKDPLIAQKLTQLILAPRTLDGIDRSVKSGTSVKLACEMAIIEQMFAACTFSGSKEVNYFDLFFNVASKKGSSDSGDLSLIEFLEFNSHFSAYFTNFALALRDRLPKDYVARCFLGTGIKHRGKKKADSCLSLISYLKTQDASLAVIENQRTVEILFEGIKSDLLNLKRQIAACPDKQTLLLYLNKIPMLKSWAYLLSEPSDWEALGIDGLLDTLTFFIERFCVELPPKDHPIISLLESLLLWKPKISEQAIDSLPADERDKLKAHCPEFFVQRIVSELESVSIEDILDRGEGEKRCKALGQKLFDFYKDRFGSSKAFSILQSTITKIGQSDHERAHCLERAFARVGDDANRWYP